MRIVVDTNVIFSAILNTDNQIARIILQPKSRLNLYSTSQLLAEIDTHSGKLRKISKYTEPEFQHAKLLITGRIRFINPKFIPARIFQKAENLTKDIDIDDTEFVALAEHAKAKLWSGDKELINGLTKKKWTKLITTGSCINLY